MTELARLKTHRATMKGFRVTEVPMGSIVSIYTETGPAEVAIVDRQPSQLGAEHVYLFFANGAASPYDPGATVYAFPPLLPGEKPVLDEVDTTPQRAHDAGPAEVLEALERGLPVAFAEAAHSRIALTARLAIDNLPHREWKAVVEYVVRGLETQGYRIVKDDTTG